MLKVYHVNHHYSATAEMYCDELVRQSAHKHISWTTHLNFTKFSLCSQWWWLWRHCYTFPDMLMTTRFCRMGYMLVW